MRVIEWLMWQMGGIGPMFGQVHHFLKYNKGKAPYAEERFFKEALRLYGVLDRRLADREFVADAYSIADIAIWPLDRATSGRPSTYQYPNVLRWYRALAARPARPSRRATTSRKRCRTFRFRSRRGEPGRVALALVGEGMYFRKLSWVRGKSLRQGTTRRQAAPLTQPIVGLLCMPSPTRGEAPASAAQARGSLVHNWAPHRPDLDQSPA